ncbi:hypothetical protein GF407_08885 [candidate division KSB1 bacterium]|nr:hypothetical protein [candidate division KSB1 bacterium]
MAKDRSFSAKTSKSAQEGQRVCQQCGEAYTNVKVVQSVKKENSDHWRFKEKIVAMCKCNEQEYYK